MKNISFENLRALRQTEIAFNPGLTVFVGANSTGKSTALDGILCFSQSLLRYADVLTPKRITSMHSTGVGDDAPMILSGSGTGMGGGFTFHFFRDETSERDQVFYQPESGDTAYLVSGDKEHQKIAEVAARHHRASRLKLDASRMSQDSLSATETPRLNIDGGNLATVLQYIAAQRDGRIEEIEDTLRQLVPHFKRVVLKPTRVERESFVPTSYLGDTVYRSSKAAGGGFSLWLDFVSDGLIPASHVSEGTLLALGLITTLSYDPPNIILMDDIQHGLHPAAQHQLAHYILTILEERDDLQVVVTTHSPYFVDACPPESVRVFGRDEDHSVKVKALTTHPEAARWLKTMHAGEFWASVGEDWLNTEGL